MKISIAKPQTIPHPTDPAKQITLSEFVRLGREDVREVMAARGYMLHSTLYFTDPQAQELLVNDASDLRRRAIQCAITYFSDEEQSHASDTKQVGGDLWIKPSDNAMASNKEEQIGR